MLIFKIIILVLLLLLSFFCIIFLLTPLFSNVPFVVSRRKAIDQLIEAVPLVKGNIVYDLGCGDGRILFSLAQKYKDISCVGVEISPFPFILARCKQYFFKLENISIQYGDFFHKDISVATHVFVYLFPEVIDKLLPKFESELQSGSQVISCDFAFSSRQPDSIIEIPSRKNQRNKKLYIYNF